MNEKVYTFELIEISAPKRSGHHAFMGWIVKNLYGLQPDFGWKLEFVMNSGLWIWNDVTDFEDHGKNLFFNALNDSLKVLMVNYEDEDPEYSFFNSSLIYHGPKYFDKFSNFKIIGSNRIYFIRNFYDCLSSRIIQTKNKIHPMEFRKKYIEIWKKQAKVVLKNPKNSLRYEDLILDLPICESFLFDNFGIQQRFKIRDVRGRISSFGDDKNYLNRFDISLLDNDLIEMIKGDNELHYLFGKLGYEYIEL